MSCVHCDVRFKHCRNYQTDLEKMHCQHSNSEEAPCSLLWEGEVKKETRDDSGRAFETIGEETHSSVLWTGEVQLQLSETKRQFFAPFTIRHKDNSKDGCRLFDWTSGKAI